MKCLFFCHKVKFLFLLLSFFISFITITLIYNVANANSNEKNYIEGKAIVCVKGGERALLKDVNNSKLGNFSVAKSLMTLDSNSRIQEAIGNKDPNLRNYLSSEKTSNLMKPANDLACELLLVDCENTEKFINQSKRLNCVMWAQPDYTIHPTSIDESQQYDIEGSTSGNTEIQDPAFEYQWAYDPSTFNPLVSINAKETWEEQESSGDVQDTVVAVIDTGVDYDHPDLHNNMWNEGTNFPSLVKLGGGAYGFDALENEDSSDPMDRDIGHGTHCASAIAASFNDIGVRGVNGNGAKILACRFMGMNGGSTSGVLQCFNYIITAKKCGVNISCISNSWGNDSIDAFPDFSLECATTEAGLNGMVDCFGSSNLGIDLDVGEGHLYSNPYTVIIGSCDDHGNPAIYSGYGQHTVDAFSPGNGMLNCVTRYEDAVYYMQEYYSWINPPEDTYYRQDFEPPFDDVNLSVIKNGDISTMRSQVEFSEGGGTTDLSWLSEGDEVMVTLPISKLDLQELIESDDCPFFSLLYKFTDIELENNCFSVKYLTDDGQFLPLAAGYCKRINYNSDTCVCKLQQNDFYKVSSDYVVIAFNFIVSEVNPTSSMTLYDFGLGKRYGIYAYRSGTSMATPVASGILSHISSRLNLSGPQLAIETAAYLKGSTVNYQSLMNKSINPGVVNLKNAYEGLTDNSKVHPVIDYSDVSILSDKSAQEVTLHGHFFGSEKSKVIYDNVTLTASDILSWTDTEIKFVVPLCEEHLCEYYVIRADSKSGRNYFKLGDAVNNYINLPTSDITYSTDKITYSSKDLNPLRSATTNSSLYVLYGASYQAYEGLMILERFDYNSQTWSSIDLSSLDIYKFSDNYYYSLACGADEIYFLHPNNEMKFNLATYSEAENKIISDVPLTTAGFGDMICNYNGELLLAGRICDYSVDRPCDIVKIYPDTGKIYDEFGNFPEFDINYNDVAFGNMSCYEDKIYISDCFKLATVYPEYGFYEGLIGGPVIYDGSDWIRGNEDIYNYSELQSIKAASAATNKGLINVGVCYSENNNSNFYDTWTYDYESDNWTLTNFSFSDVKVRCVTSVCHNNNFYVIAKRSIFKDLAFRMLPLSKLDVSSQNVELNVIKEFNPTPGPIPQPTPEPIDNPISPSAPTGDIFMLLMCLLGLIMFISFGYLNKDSVYKNYE